MTFGQGIPYGSSIIGGLIEIIPVGYFSMGVGFGVLSFPVSGWSTNFKVYTKKNHSGFMPFFGLYYGVMGISKPIEGLSNFTNSLGYSYSIGFDSVFEHSFITVSFHLNKYDIPKGYKEEDYTALRGIISCGYGIIY